MAEVTVHHGDSREVLKTLADASVDACVCDPPYALVSIGKRFGKEGSAPAKAGKTGAYQRASAGFMGKTWDTGETAFAAEFWAEVLRVLKPGGHVVAFSGTRTFHRMACAIEDAGFEIRDQAAWVYGSGFPKSHDVSKAIDKHLGHQRKKVRVPASQVRNQKTAGGGKDGAAGATRPYIDRAQERGFHEAESPEAESPEAEAWSGWGTALKPAWEPICVARKPLDGTVAANVLTHGCGALNIDSCRVGDAGGHAYAGPREGADPASVNVLGHGLNGKKTERVNGLGRWPANVVHDGSDEVVAAFLEAPGQQGVVTGNEPNSPFANVYGDMPHRSGRADPRGDIGTVARFFYTAKADAEDRLGSKHPTVKPVDLMAWLCRLVTPPGGVILDPFAGTGTTGLAAMREGFDCILIEREAEYVADIERRLAWARGEGRLTSQEVNRHPAQPTAHNGPALFTDLEPPPAIAVGSSTASSPGTPDRTDRPEEVNP